MGKISVNGQFSIDMLDNQRVPHLNPSPLCWYPSRMMRSYFFTLLRTGDHMQHANHPLF